MEVLLFARLMVEVADRTTFRVQEDPAVVPVQATAAGMVVLEEEVITAVEAEAAEVPVGTPVMEAQEAH
tara:strand:- start:2013 stop:2219 length:207 start_codon:yes stop_codon:yes gene_type:complete